MASKSLLSYKYTVVAISEFKTNVLSHTPSKLDIFLFNILDITILNRTQFMKERKNIFDTVILFKINLN